MPPVGKFVQTPCSFCGEKKPDQLIYRSPTGKCYHIDKDCRGLNAAKGGAKVFESLAFFAIVQKTRTSRFVKTGCLGAFDAYRSLR